MPLCSVTGKIFTISEAESNYCQQRGIPLPTVAHYERLRHLLSFYNSIFLYNSTCDLTGKPMLSIVPPSKDIKVYDIGVWMDDTAWDPMVYGRDFDFSRPFFEQFAALQKDVPVPSRSVVLSTMENSEYTNGVSNVKNCYLIFDCNNCEDCYFCYQMDNAKNVVDCIDINDCELCYGSKHLKKCYNIRFAENCTNCSDSSFLYNCRNVKNCFGCTNLSNKEYCWYNQQLTPEEFKIRNAKFKAGSYQILADEIKKFNAFKAHAFEKDITGILNEQCTGNYIDECKGCRNTFYSTQAEDCEYCSRANKSKNCFTYAIFGLNAELVYESVVCGHNVYNVQFCMGCFVNVSNLEYCMHVGFGSKNCFGCIGIRKKEYCIFNKQYSKENYFDMLTRIKKHMIATGEYGKFFPASFSNHFYNKSEAANFFPLTKTEALERGYSWEDEVVENFTQTYQIPDHMKDVEDNILNEVLKCEISGKKYRIIKQELELYRRFQLPIPRIAPLERLHQNCKSLQIPELWARTCSKCHIPITTVHNKPHAIVYCEKCFAEVTS